MTRKCFIFPIPEIILTEILSGSGFRVLKNNLPCDAKFITAYYEPDRRALVVIYEHDSFPETPEGEMLPLGKMDCWLERIEEEEEE